MKRRQLLALALLTCTAALLGSAWTARQFETGPQYECVAVPMAYTQYKVWATTQDASELELYPTRLPRGWTPMGVTDLDSRLEVTARALTGSATESKNPAVVACRRVDPDAPEERPAALPPRPRAAPVEKVVDPDVFRDE